MSCVACAFKDADNELWRQSCEMLRYRECLNRNEPRAKAAPEHTGLTMSGSHDAKALPAAVTGPDSVGRVVMVLKSRSS